MARTSLISPLRTLACPRPAIQAWRSARCFATEISPATASSTIANPPTITASSAILESVSASPSLAAESDALFPGSIAIAPVEQNAQSSEEAAKSKKGPVGVVVSAGKMQKTVKVRIPGHKLNKHLRKYFREDTNYLVHDPNSSLKTGDVVSLSAFRAAKHVHHVVQEILVPFGTPIADRAPVPTEADRRAEYEAKRSKKLERRSLRRAAAQGSETAIEKLKAMGLGPEPEAEKKGKKTQSGKKR